jgi:uncharacterized protein YcfJ
VGTAVGVRVVGAVEGATVGAVVGYRVGRLVGGFVGRGVVSAPVGTLVGCAAPRRSSVRAHSTTNVGPVRILKRCSVREEREVVCLISRNTEMSSPPLGDLRCKRTGRGHGWPARIDMPMELA